MGTYSNLHGRHRYRPSVERFGGEQQAAFRRFCASLLQFATAPTRAQRLLPPPAVGGSLLQ